VSYDKRQASVNTDGTPIYAVDYDKQHEVELARMLEGKWNCEVRRFGRLCSLDFYILRDGRLVGVAELKSRTHATTTYPTVYLNLRKWLALSLAAMGLGCPALFVVRFTDGVRYINVNDIDARQVSFGGCRQVVKSHTDREPVIEVPVVSMTRFAEAERKSA
jgi:hypothetical protein